LSVKYVFNPFTGNFDIVTKEQHADFHFNVTPTTANNQDFETPDNFIADSLCVYIDGIRQEKIYYTVTGSNTFSLTFTKDVDQVLVVDYIKGEGEPPTPPVDAFTKLLLHCDGDNESTSFPDASASEHVVTAVGTAQVSTAQKKFGTGSASFDGNSDYLTIPDSDDWFLGTNDFTIDFWVKMNANQEGGFFGQYENANNYSGCKYNGNTIFFYGRDSGVNRIYVTCPWTYSTDWTHFALVRSGTGTNDLKIYINGEYVTTTLIAGAWDGAFSNIISPFYVGTWLSVGEYLNGYIDEFRISKGVARWTANFTPPTEAY